MAMYEKMNNFNIFYEKYHRYWALGRYLYGHFLNGYVIHVYLMLFATVCEVKEFYMVLDVGRFT